MSRLAARRLTPEILDSLPPSDRCAIGSRRDLVRLNWIMRQDVIMAKLLRSAARPPREILDLGAGDGRFMLRVARRLAPASPPVVLTLLDRHDLVSDATRSAFTALGWRIETVRAHALAMLNAASQDRYDAITANLFLHHFDRDVLFELLGAAASRTRLFCATEPRRDFLALMGSRMVWALGCNDVSRHDARVSVEAGFRDRELSEAWTHPSEWSLDERKAGLFTHAFSARREGA